MAALKAHEVEGFVKRPDLSLRYVLVYGPDSGLVSERAEAIAAAHLKGNTDPFALVRLEGDAVTGDPPRLSDEMRTIGLFGGERVVRVRGAGGAAAKSFAGIVQAVMGGPEPAASLVVEAGDLKAGTPVRKLFETSKAAIALPCYPDEARDLARLIDEEMAAAGLTMTAQARALVMEHLGGDRLASRQELRKIALYCHGRRQVEAEDVAAVSGDVSAIAIDDVVDPVVLGEIDPAVRALGRLTGEGTHPSVVAGAALRHMMQIQAARAEIDRGRTATDAMEAIGLRLFYKRQGLFQRQLVVWTTARAEKAIETLQAAVLESRRHPHLAPAIVERALLSVATAAKRRA